MTITRSFITLALSHPDLTWYKNVGTSIFRFVTMHAFDRQTDRQTDGRTDRRTEMHWKYRALHYTQSHGNEIHVSTFILNPFTSVWQ